MTTDDEAVAAAIDPRPQDGEPLDDYYSTPTRHLIAGSDRIRALSARVADLEEVVADKRRLVRDLNAALDDTPASESLCDAVSVALRLRQQKEAAEQRVAELTASLQHIAGQKIRGEFDDEEWGEDEGGPEWEDGYEALVTEARAALAHTATQPEATPGKGE